MWRFLLRFRAIFPFPFSSLLLLMMYYLLSILLLTWLTDGLTDCIIDGRNDRMMKVGGLICILSVFVFYWWWRWRWCWFGRWLMNWWCALFLFLRGSSIDSCYQGQGRVVVYSTSRLILSSFVSYLQLSRYLEPLSDFDLFLFLTPIDSHHNSERNIDLKRQYQGNSHGTKIKHLSALASNPRSWNQPGPVPSRPCLISQSMSVLMLMCYISYPSPGEDKTG